MPGSIPGAAACGQRFCGIRHLYFVRASHFAMTHPEGLERSAPRCRGTPADPSIGFRFSVVLVPAAPPSLTVSRNYANFNHEQATDSKT